MEQSVANHIAQRSHYWFRSSGPYSLENFVKESVSDLVARFVDPHENIFWFGHDISQVVLDSHPLLSAYTQSDERVAKKEISTLVSKALLPSEENHTDRFRSVYGNLKKYGARRGHEQPVFYSDVQSSEQALIRIWSEAEQELEKFKSLNFSKKRIAVPKNKKGNDAMQNFKAFNSDVRFYFRDSSSLVGFLNDSIISSEVLPYIAHWIEPDNRNGTPINSVLLPYFLLVGIGSLKAVVNHSVHSMQTRLKKEIYER